MRSFGRFTWIWLTTVVGLPFVLRAEPGTPADTPSATVGSTNASATAGSAAGTVSQAPGAGAANKSVQPSALVSYEVEQIAKLKQAGVEVSVLQAYVEHSTALRPPNADEIVYLHDNGVPNEVLTALIRRGNELGTQAEQAAASRTQTAQATPPAPAAPSTPAPAALTYPAYDYSYPVDVGAAYPAYTWTSPYWYWWSTPFYSSYYYYRPCGPVARPTYCPPRIHGGIQASVGFGRPLGTGVRGPRPAFGAPRPAFGAPRPAFGAPRPAFGAARPAFASSRPAFGASRPAFGAARPAFGAARPAVGVGYRRR